MAHHRLVNVAALCVLVFLIAALLHRPTDGGIELYQNHAKENHKSSILPDDNRRASTPFHDHDTLPQTNPGSILRPRVDPVKNSKEFTTAVESGTSLLCMMRMTKEEAAAWALASPKWADRHPVASRFNDPDDLKLWGWVDEDDMKLGPNSAAFLSTRIKSELYPFMNQLGLKPEETSEWLQAAHHHEKDYYIDGVFRPSIFGSQYSGVINKDKNNIAMVVNTMFSPTWAVKTHNTPGPGPDLARPSDVWFLQLYLQGQKHFDFPKPAKISRIPAPKHIFIQDIVTAEVEALLVELFKRKGLGNTDGEPFDADSEDGKMLIGTKHGSAVAMFLIQHKDFFGDLAIRSVKVWQFIINQEFSRWCLCFVIGNADGSDGGGGVGRRWEELVQAKL